MIHDEQLNHSKIRIVNFISFLLGFSQAILIYVLSSFFKIASGTENVGFFYFISYGLTLIILLNMHKAVSKLGKSNILYFSLLLSIASVFGLIMSPSSFLSVALVILYIAFLSVALVATDVILESFSVDNMSGRIRGFHLMLLNCGFILGPLLSTKLLDAYGYHGIFIILLAINSLILVFSLIGLRSVNHRFEKKLKTFQLIKEVFQRKDIRRVYYISFVLEFFYALMIIYTPIYLRNLGVSWSDIGIIFTVMLIPFVVLQYPAGIIADKKLGEKELFIGSLILMGLSTFLILFIKNNNLIVWAIILLVTRIGASLIEVLRDSYFYKRIDGHDVDLINFFRTAVPVAYILAAIISTPLLFFFSIKAIFIVVSLVVLSALIPAIRLEDNSPC